MELKLAFLAINFGALLLFTIAIVSLRSHIRHYFLDHTRRSRTRISCALGLYWLMLATAPLCFACLAGAAHLYEHAAQSEDGFDAVLICFCSTVIMLLIGARGSTTALPSAAELRRAAGEE